MKGLAMKHRKNTAFLVVPVLYHIDAFVGEKTQELLRRMGRLKIIARTSKIIVGSLMFILSALKIILSAPFFILRTLKIMLSALVFISRTPKTIAGALVLFPGYGPPYRGASI
jgi:hypothetical protein